MNNLKDADIEEHFVRVNNILLRFGWLTLIITEDESCIMYQYIHVLTEEIRHTLYVKESYRNKKIFTSKSNLKFITLPECNLVDLYKRKNVDYLLCEDGCESAYSIIEKFYEGKYSKRGNIPYINHIDQGLGILYLLNASLDAKQAFCYHPIYQVGLSLNFEDYATTLAKKYSIVANKYLLKNYKENYVKDLSFEQDIKNMLIADKVQNYTSAKKHGLLSRELKEYFYWWFDVLDISHQELDFYSEYIRFA